MSQAAITLYGNGWCPYCQRARALLTKKGLAFSDINLDDDDKLRDQMIARSGRSSVPQIFIGEHHVGGCDDLYALEERGELDRLIEGA